MQSLQTLIKRWQSESIELLPPESESAVRATFETLGVQATPDVIALYGSIGGMNTVDAQDWELWPLEKIKRNHLANPSGHGVIFSDYMYSCWWYRLLPRANGTSAVYVDYGDDYPMLVAASLEEFFDRYLADASDLLERQAIRLPLENFEQELW